MDIPLSFVFAKDIITHLMTTAAALVGFTVSLAREPKKASGPSKTPKWLRWLSWFRWFKRAKVDESLAVSWFVLALSFAFGVVALMTMTGLLAEEKVDSVTVYAGPLRVWSGLQMLLLFVGVVLLAYYGMSHGVARADDGQAVERRQGGDRRNPSSR